MTNEFNKLKDYVYKRPVVLFRQSLEGSEFDFDGKSDFTLDCPLDTDFRNGTLCIVEFFGSIIKYCCLGWFVRYKSKITFKKIAKIENLGKLVFSSLNDIAARPEFGKNKIDLERFEGNCLKLTPMRSETLLNILIEFNPDIVRKAADKLNYYSSTNVSRQHEDARKLAFKVFGLEPKKSDIYKLKLTEDMAISLGARQIDGYILEDTDYGKSVFRSNTGEGFLTVYESHRNILESLFGVDLIYINEPCNNIVMVQYKMLERTEVKGGIDWVYKSDGQLDKEIARMNFPKNICNNFDYRLNENPFYLRFIKRFRGAEAETRSINISLEHYKKISEQQQSNIKISYGVLNGTYLRETEFVALIHSGYIGTHSVDTDFLKKIIGEIRSDNREVIVAWQHCLTN